MKQLKAQGYLFVYGVMYVLISFYCGDCDASQGTYPSNEVKYIYPIISLKYATMSKYL